MFLQINRVSVRYPGRDRCAVLDVDLAMQAGDIGVLIGPSGCGKTSLLRAVAGLEPIEAGEIHLDGKCLGSPRGQLPPEQRRMGMVFQDYALFPHLSVAENVAFGLRSMPAQARRARVDEMLALVGLSTSAASMPHEMSGGQQQRVALARALAPQPRLMLFDEPFSSLDIELRERLATELRVILKAAGCTALFVTHDQLEAFALGDVIGVMADGRLHQWDDAYSVYHRPKTRFVAEFIGQSVMVAAQWQRQAQGWTLQTPVGELSAALAAAAGGPTGTDAQCDVLLRADDIVHDDASPVRAEVVRKVFRGAEFLYTLRLAQGETVLALVPSHHDHQIGEQIGIRAELEHVVTFPRG